MRRYSIAFMPPANQIAYVKSKKDTLFSTIGWYHSRNAKAHITVLEFEATERQLKAAVAYLEQFSKGIHPFRVKFDCVDTFGSALCFLPSIQSKRFLSAVMKAFIECFPLPCGFSNSPHITIGRRLAKNQLGIGRSRFAEEKPELAFEADGLFLRRLNERRGQYDVIRKFEFLGEEVAMLPIVVQQTLFD